MCWDLPVVIVEAALVAIMVCIVVVVVMCVGIVVAPAVCFATVPSALDEGVAELVLHVGSSGLFWPGAPPVSG